MQTIRTISWEIRFLKLKFMFQSKVSEYNKCKTLLAHYKRKRKSFNRAGQRLCSSPITFSSIYFIFIIFTVSWKYFLYTKAFIIIFFKDTSFPSWRTFMWKKLWVRDRGITGRWRILCLHSAEVLSHKVCLPRQWAA